KLLASTMTVPSTKSRIVWINSRQPARRRGSSGERNMRARRERSGVGWISDIGYNSFLGKMPDFTALNLKGCDRSNNLCQKFGSRIPISQAFPARLRVFQA